MLTLRLLIIFFSATAIGLLDGCSQGNSGDQPQTSTAGVPVGIERFLLFPNPVMQPGGSFETNTTAYAQAYYTAIDPGATRDTLSKWKAANGFGTGGQEYTAVFLDVRDLGYGRRMTGRINNSDGSIAFFVENYLVSTAGGGYSSTINVDAAVVRDTKWHIGTNAIEWSCFPQTTMGCVKFAKYYSFSPDGTRTLTIDMDGRGQKAMPGPCITCHGGRGDPLDPGPLFPFVANTEPGQSGQRGDVLGHLHRFSVDTFQWSTTPGFTRADQEATLKTFNQWVLCSYPLVGSSTKAEDTCRPSITATPNGWQGTDAAELIKQAYGGPGMNSSQYSDTFVPTGWKAGSPNTPDSETLYQQVVVPFCRTCHIVRGTINQSDIDFSTEDKFLHYADRIKAHVFDRGNMPLALLVYQDFWRSTAPQTLATYLNNHGVPATVATDANGKALQPGRPIADLGPAFRMAKQGTPAPLSAANSLFASSYSWSITDPPGASAAISNPTSQAASFQANLPGLYTVQLTVTAGSRSDSKTTKILVPDNSDPTFSFQDPASVKFAQVVDVLRNKPYLSATQGCTDSGCHIPGGAAPILYDEPDLALLLARLRGRVNLTDIAASPLLLKPTGHHHAGNEVIPLSAINTNPSPLSDLNLKAALGSFSKVYYWILNGMPAGGIVARAKDGRSTPTTPIAFTGPGQTFSVALTGIDSIGAVNYAWTIDSEPDPTNALGRKASLTNAGTMTPTLILKYPAAATDPTPYVVRLVVDDGAGTTDTVKLTVPVIEETLTASFVPPAGDVQFPFADLNPATTAAVGLTATVGGNPVKGCSWSAVPGPGAPAPTGTTFDNPTSCSMTNFTVPVSAIGFYYDVTFTANNVSHSVPATNRLTVRPPAGSSPTNPDFTFGSPTITFTIDNNLANAGSPRAIMGANTLTATTPGGLAPFTYAWSATASASAGASGCAISGSGQTVSLIATSVGNCDVTVTANNAIGPAASKTHTVAVASGIVFADVAGVFSPAGCVTAGCHLASSLGAGAPSWQEPGLLSRVQSSANSGKLLTCPTAGCGTMTGNRNGFGAGGNYSNYDIFFTWIRNGQP